MGILDGLRGGSGTGDGDDGRETSLVDLGGLADAFRKERAGMQKVPKVASRSSAADEPEDEPTPEEARAAALAGPLAHGGVDPTTLLTYDDVEAITGDRIDDSVVGFAPSFVSVVFHGAAGTYRLASIHGASVRGRWKATKAWKGLVEGYGDAVPVDGLGDAAIRTGEFTLVRSGDAILFVEVTRTDPADDDVRALGDHLLRAAMARLPSSGTATA